MTEQQILEKLIPLIREITGARPAQIQMESGLMQDLGAESIDLLDLSFLIEEAFGITIEPDEFERQAKAMIPDGVFDIDGVLTDMALAQLKKALPEVPQEHFTPGLRKIDLPGILTVAVFVHIIQRKLALKGQ